MARKPEARARAREALLAASSPSAPLIRAREPRGPGNIARSVVASARARSTPVPTWRCSRQATPAAGSRSVTLPFYDRRRTAAPRPAHRHLASRPGSALGLGLDSSIASNSSPDRVEYARSRQQLFVVELGERRSPSRLEASAPLLDGPRRPRSVSAVSTIRLSAPSTSPAAASESSISVAVGGGDVGGHRRALAPERGPVESATAARIRVAQLRDGAFRGFASPLRGDRALECAGDGLQGLGAVGPGGGHATAASSATSSPSAARSGCSAWAARAARSARIRITQGMIASAASSVETQNAVP